MTLLHPKLIVMALGAVTLLVPSAAESPMRDAAPPPTGAVRIEHHLIRVSPPPPQARRPRPSPVNRLALRRSADPRPAGGFAARAGRLLMGDGRYRPEPFPRPGR